MEKFTVTRFYHVWRQAEVEAESEEEVDRMLEHDEIPDEAFQQVEESWEDTFIEVSWK